MAVESVAGPDGVTFYANFTTRYTLRTIGRHLDHGELSFELEAYEAESTVYEHTIPVFIAAGRPGSPSTTEDWIRAGTPGRF